MKKILTASLVAMMAVTAANADIASTQYVNKKLTGDAENSTLSFTGAAANQTTLQGAVNAIADSLSQNLGEGGNVSQQIQGAVQGLDVDEIAVADGKYVKTVSETDGKVSVTTADLVGQINESGDNKNDNSLVAPTTAAVTGYVVNKLNVMSEGVSKDMAAALLTVNQDIGDLQQDKADKTALEETDKKVATLNGDVNTAGSVAKAVADAKSDLQGKIDAINNADTGVLKLAKDYTDDLANGAVAANTGAITKLNGDANTDGSVAKAVADAKSDLQGKIDAINNAETGVLKLAKDYTDDLANGAVAANTGAINAINNETTGIKALANKYTDDQIDLLDAEAEVVGTNDGSYVTAVAQTDGKIKVSTVAFDNALNANSTNAVQNSVVNTAIEGIKTNLGGLNGKNIDTVPTSCAAGGNGTCSLVMKNGEARWEVVEY